MPEEEEAVETTSKWRTRSSRREVGGVARWLDGEGEAVPHLEKNKYLYGTEALEFMSAIENGKGTDKVKGAMAEVYVALLRRRWRSWRLMSSVPKEIAAAAHADRGDAAADAARVEETKRYPCEYHGSVKILVQEGRGVAEITEDAR